tara:strand:- start:400 stop:504 length:105 start_codon:yes stop_codon:yes gene_type:complete
LEVLSDGLQKADDMFNASPNNTDIETQKTIKKDD